MATIIEPFSFILPDPGGDINNWGSMLNANFQKISDMLAGSETYPFSPNFSSFFIAGVEVTASAAEVNILDGATLSTAELNILDGVTATAAELNILDGVTASTAELNLLDGAENHDAAAWAAGTATTPGLPTPAEVRAAATVASGNTPDMRWRTVFSPPRTYETVYVNNNDYMMDVSVTVYSTNLVTLFVRDATIPGSPWVPITTTGVSAGAHRQLYARVPPGHEYRITEPNLAVYGWAELRGD